jgi:hypothetical protein
MINPVDQSTVKAMVDYKLDQINRDRYEDGIGIEIPSQQLRSSRWVFSLRRSAGLSLMRLGARLAGIGMHARIGTQL